MIVCICVSDTHRSPGVVISDKLQVVLGTSVIHQLFINDLFTIYSLLHGLIREEYQVTTICKLVLKR